MGVRLVRARKSRFSRVRGRLDSFPRRRAARPSSYSVLWVLSVRYPCCPRCQGNTLVREMPVGDCSRVDASKLHVAGASTKMNVSRVLMCRADGEPNRVKPSCFSSMSWDILSSKVRKTGRPTTMKVCSRIANRYRLLYSSPSFYQ